MRFLSRLNPAGVRPALRCAALAGLVVALGGHAEAQTRYGSYVITHEYDPFDTIPGTETQGGIGSGRVPSPARPMILGADGEPVYVAADPLLPGPQNVDPRRYGRLTMTPYERQLYFAKNPAAYARRHRYDAPHPYWPGEATNPVVAATRYRPGPAGAARPVHTDHRGRDRVRDPAAIGDPFTP